MSKNIWFVIPCYNEEEVIIETTKRLWELMNRLVEEDKILDTSRILYVDDGSSDKTWEIICELSEKCNYVSGLKLANNRGHQNALLAGLMYSKEYADAVISMDADLQDDINACEEMIEKFYEGFDVVFGVRKSRKKDTFFKRKTAECFYSFMKMLGADVVMNHADYRLMSKEALSALSQYSEVNLFLRGIVKDIGFKNCCVYYERGERFAGKSKYPLKKMISFAVEGITSFSVRPIKIAGFLGTVSILISILMLIYCIFEKIAGRTVPGWSSLGVSIWAVGGIQLFIMGIIGEYVGKIYLESKQRPRYIIEKTVNL